VTRCLEELRAAGHGEPPVAFDTLVLGSGGRGESFLEPDQDNAMVLDDHPAGERGSVDAWFVELAGRICTMLERVGFPRCHGKVMVTNPLWRRTLSEWRAQVAHWMGHADAYGLLKSLHQEGFSRPLYSVVNMAASLQQAAAAAVRFSKCARQFLAVSVNNIGYILKDSTVGAALAARRPYTVHAPQARASRNTANIAASLLKIEDTTIRTASAFSRYLNVLKREETR